MKAIFSLLAAIFALAAIAFSDASHGDDSDCTTCHEDKTAKPVLHMAIQMDGCTGCHVRHEEDAPFAPQLRHSTNETCMICHDGSITPGNHPFKGHPTEGEKDPLYPQKKI